MTVLAMVCVSAAIAEDRQTATIVGRADVVDGDGLKIGPVAVRIFGIDAPEKGQSCPTEAGGTWECGRAATDFMDELVGGREVVCSARDRDAYGRIVASCTVNARDVAERIMEAGLAWAFVRYSDAYIDIEATARKAGLGVWLAPAQPPWEYRADRWNRAVAAAPNGCPIKGNISSGDERIYHTPWSSWYSRTTINEAQGERWFCDEAEARAAGWRRAEGR